MLGAGLQFNRSRREDRFYNPRARRNFQNQQKTHQLQRAQSDITMGQCKEKSAISWNRELDNLAKEAPESVALPAVDRVTFPLSNVERFLEAITPSVPAQYPSKRAMIGLRTCDVEPYFVLADLWESFKEWSAYGAGVPLVLNGCDSVVQYYVPYLSAIQIYIDPSKSKMKSRRASEDSDGDYFSRDSSSDGSSDSERERISAYSSGHRNHYKTANVSCKMDKLSLIDEQTSLHEGFSSDDGELGNSQEQLVFQYLEHDPPFCREPLFDKISDLALRFPDIKNLRSCDVMPSSWVSVAWYPIYRIPTGPTLKDLDACFLTYHSLYTQIGDVAGPYPPVLTHPNDLDVIPKISLPAFGLASYKYRGSLWTSSNGADRVNSLSQEAAAWLRRHQVNHPDYSFFSRR